MATRTIRLLGAACIGLVLVLTLTSVLSAQRSAAEPEPAALQALLHEVQLLRTAIERAVLINSRMQLSLLRLNVEQQRVADLSGVLRGVQAELAAVTATGRGLTQELDSVVRTRNRAGDQAQQRDVEGQILYIEGRLEEQRISDAYEAGYEDGESSDVSKFEAWTKG